MKPTLKGELFATDMVIAYLDGRKKHTARPVRPPYFVDQAGKPIVMRTAARGSYAYRKIGLMPYPDAPYKAGDYMYCRETWRETGVLSQPYAYRASEEDLNLVGESGQLLTLKYRWRPSIHMPKEAARLFFRVPKVEVVRLDKVTERFALDDGFLPSDGIFSALDNFKSFWYSTYGDAKWMWVYWTEPCSRTEAERETA